MKHIILIGPIGVGKTTVGKLLSKKLSMPFYSLDLEERKYTTPVGYDAAYHEQLRGEKGVFAAYDYVRGFFDEAVVCFLKSRKQGIFELGGGHPIVPNPQKQQRVIKALKPHQYIFLLMPTQNIEESLRLLRKRNKVKKDEDLNILYFKDKTFWKIARFVVYTNGKVPKETCEEILKQL